MIKAFTGMNGSGKTLLAVELEVIPALRAGRHVLTNVHLRPEVLGDRVEQVTLLTSLHQLLEPIPGSLVLLDEIATVFPSRAWSSMPGQIHAGLQQLRKRGLDLVWTAPSWARADVTLREITLEVTQCKALWKKKYQRKGFLWYPMPWPRARYVLANTWFDPTEYVAGKVKGGLAGRGKGQHVVRVLGTTAHRLYDTLEPVETLQVHLLGEGVCLECNGRRSRPACKCHVEEVEVLGSVVSRSRGKHLAVR